MSRVPGKNSPPEPSIVRTNKDWIMIILGVALILFFFVAGYVAILQEGRSPGQKFRGPVKDPRGGMSLKSRALVGFVADDSIRNGFKTCKFLEEFLGRPFMQNGPPQPPQKNSHHFGP